LHPRPASCCALLLACLLAAPAAAQEVPEDEASYEFLDRQGQLLFDYGKFDEAADVFDLACATAEGATDFECWRRLGISAEKAGRVGLAIDAWRSALTLGGEGSRIADQELSRLLDAFGEVQFEVPPGRSLPTIVGLLEYEGLLIDPMLKSFLGAIQDRVAQYGIERASLWLPGGQYRFEDISFVVAPGRLAELVLPSRVVPYRPGAFRAPGGPVLAPAGGPSELGFDVEVLAGGIPGGGLGNQPAGVGGRLRIGRHIGPLRLEIGGRIAATPVRSKMEDPDKLRSGAAVQLLAQLDVGVDLALGSRLYLTPHAAVVAGSMGQLLVGCRVEQEGTLRVWDGECRMDSLAAGGQAGVDLLFVPPSSTGRLALRFGLMGEALAGGLVGVPGDRLEGDLEEVDLVSAHRWRFTWLRAGVDVGLSLRF
jgi:hypothetical protein